MPESRVLGRIVCCHKAEGGRRGVAAGCGWGSGEGARGHLSGQEALWSSENHWSRTQET